MPDSHPPTTSCSRTYAASDTDSDSARQQRVKGWANVSWQTKKIKGLHENDFIMAPKASKLSGA